MRSEYNSFIRVLPIFAAALVAVATFVPGTRLWGIDHLSYLPERTRLLALAVIAAGLVPAIAAGVFRAMSRIVDWGAESKTKSAVLVVALMTLAGAMLASMQSATLLWGDGRVIAGTWRAAASDSLGAAHYLSQIVANEHVYPGTDATLLAATRAAAAFSAADPADGIRALVTILGVLLVGMVGLLVVRARAGVLPRLMLLMVILTSGAMALFAGYVEAYAPLLLLGGLFGVAGFGVVSAGWPLRYPLMLCVLAVIMHIQAVLLVPALVVLMFSRRGGDKRMAVAVVIALSALVPLAAAQFPFASRYLLAAPAALSPRHLLDVVNELLLISPLLPFVIALLVRARDGGAERDELLFAVALAVPATTFLFLFRPELGMARDWDLFAVIIVPVCALAWVAARRLPHALESSAGASLASMALTGAVLTLSWLAINADPAASVSRFERSIRHDRARADYALENLSLFHRDRGNVSAELDALERASSVADNPRQWYRLGMRRFETGDTEGAIMALQSALAGRPDYEIARQALVQVLYLARRYDMVVAECADGAAWSPRSAFYPFMAGRAHLDAGRTDAARESLQASMSLDPPPEIAAQVRDILGRMGTGEQ